MKVISTFSGCGGSSLGYKMAGCEVVAAVEWEDNAVAAYRANHPNTKMFHGDIAKVTGAQLMEATGLGFGELDILDGSPPCQGFSTAGQRALNDPRNKLFQQQLRLIDELGAKHVVIENVSGMIKGKMKRVAGEIVRALKERGYRVAAGLLEAQYFGVGQARARVFFVGSRTHDPSLPRPTSRVITAGRALAGVVPLPTPSPPPSARLFMKHGRPGEDAGSCRIRLGLKGNQFGMKMLHPQRPSNALTKVDWNFFHWERRLLAVNERLVLTGFPEDYILPGSFSEQCARIGNSVAPPMTEAIARALMAGHKEAGQDPGPGALE